MPEREQDTQSPTAKRRVPATAWILSAACLVGLVVSEGYTDRAIIPVPGDVPTIGFGTTEGVKLGDRITPPQALARALSDIGKFDAAIRQCVKVPLHQHEYDVAVSFAYNVGGAAFCSSTLVRLWNLGDYEGGCNELTRWVYVKGRKVQGLVNRRERERLQCLGISEVK